MILIRRKKLPIKSTMVKKKRRPNAKSLSDLIDMDKQKTDGLTPSIPQLRNCFLRTCQAKILPVRLSF